jgi:hypothetical protein
MGWHWEERNGIAQGLYAMPREEWLRELGTLNLEDGTSK